MVAIINYSYSIPGTLKYNEKKLELKCADCIYAGNYAKDLHLLSYSDKLHRLEHQAALNERAKAKTVHISLNFHRDDKLPVVKLQLISEEYMSKIGFGEQPYLVYEHHDAGHQHLHIVTINIRPDGKQIRMHNIARNQSDSARKELEIKYALVRAGGRDINQTEELRPNPGCALKVIYGKSETILAIGNVLAHVLHFYNFINIDELNAVLIQYNLMADRGTEGSVMYQKNGLFYRVLNQFGKKIGIPVKASILPQKPTLKNLETIFDKNLFQKMEQSKKIKTSLDWILYKNKRLFLQRLKEELRLEGISAMISRDKNGFIEGMIYIDHKRGAVINGDELGPKYGAKSILEKCGIIEELLPVLKMGCRNAILPIEENLSEHPGLNRGEQFPAKTEDPLTGLYCRRGLAKKRILTLDALIRSLPQKNEIPSQNIPVRQPGQRLLQRANWYRQV
jgi:hypothetical protein